MSATPRNIDYFFSIVSPWTFLGHARFMAAAARHDAQVRFIPVELGSVFAESGGLPLARRAPQRQRYRLLELQRWRVKLGVDFHIHPAHWPLNGALADKVLIAALARGHNIEPLLPLIFSGIWQKQQNLADPQVIAAVCDAAGLPGADLLAAAETAEVDAAYLANREQALAADVFGAPAYVLDGEVFWGQDRIELLDDALASGRAPFHPVERA
ncbi:MAG: disulfide bond formation protein DsbA [Rhizobiales bacterium 24-66-13]|jgi:2-hydroxychromene-2-carboxylate isomerase|nr:MAG: disulfide bond formation protein DsbA [Azorhizobium sp. 12-66-6]OYY83502.1 MAG: disulfide bond formation protein DsbA [Rhizobiales bacterium 35-66-30]OYZ73051.1 MAG: disulfide bond formation protein DsbA [Rhizobiales bacterium 24-66-13]OZA96636.1 MAG: disulfide bond formation protein DsbA [Rhizobiales bacterium 39-66-18]HQS09037.1 2-hydroxychromene-2-carboxylate isomerase [Xanthobacteraceae bacterium]